MTEMSASRARKAAREWMKKVTEENAQWNEVRTKQQARISADLWKKRGPALVAEIDGYIKKASVNGEHGIYEPSEINPYGDPIIWLEEADRPIHKLLMDHYRLQGFRVLEYTPIGLKIEW
jgi:hypothetical protein